MLRRERELQAALLARPKSDSLKAFQFLHGARHACRYVSDVKLHYLIARAVARVLHFNAHAKPAVGANSFGAQSQVRELELCVAQSKPEREERRYRHVQV